jgi:hypothetical protein
MCVQKTPCWPAVGAAVCVAAAIAGCSATMRLRPLPPRHVPARTDLAVAVLPFGDSRPRARENAGAWLLVPLVPWVTSEEPRPDEAHAAEDSPDHFRSQVRERLVEQLKTAGIFARVDLVDGPDVDPARYPLMLAGELRQSLRRQRRTAYGLSVAGMALWLLGAPIGWNEIDWELALELRDTRSGKVLKRLEGRRAEKKWTALYWGAAGFPAGEAQALRPMVADLLAGIDEALTDVPELAALIARPVLASSHAPPSLGQPACLAGETVLVVSPPHDELSQSLAELVSAETERQSGARVLGIADLNALLGLQAQRDLVGCSDSDCFADVVAVLNPRYVLAIAMANLGGSQMLTLKVLDPRNATVLSRTTWTAAGAEPSAFAERLPEIVREALMPLAQQR